MFLSFIEELRGVLKMPLPGEDAQYKMAPYRKVEQIFNQQKVLNKSAVLALLYPRGEEIYTVLMLRSTYRGVHSAQISFPGGKMNIEDVSLEHTALRETEEEIGVSKKDITIIGSLSKVPIPVSGFVVKPFIGFLSKSPTFKPDPTEVEEVIEVPLKLLIASGTVKKKKLKLSGGAVVQAPYYDINGHTVWGATAMMISELTNVLNLIRNKDIFEK